MSQQRSDQQMNPELAVAYVLVGGYLRDYLESVEEAKKRIAEAEKLERLG